MRIEGATWIDGGGSAGLGLIGSIRAAGGGGAARTAGADLTGSCGLVSGAFFAKGDPQSKQNLAAGGLPAPQLAHGFSAGAATGSGTLAGGGGSGARRRLATPTAAPAATPAAVAATSATRLRAGGSAWAGCS